MSFRQEPEYNGNPLENLKIWMEFHLLGWHLNENTISFKNTEGEKTIGKAFFDEPTKTLTLTMETTNHYLVALSNKGSLIRNLDLKIVIIHEPKNSSKGEK